MACGYYDLLLRAAEDPGRIDIFDRSELRAFRSPRAPARLIALGILPERAPRRRHGRRGVGRNGKELAIALPRCRSGSGGSSRLASGSERQEGSGRGAGQAAEKVEHHPERTLRPGTTRLGGSTQEKQGEL